MRLARDLPLTVVLVAAAASSLGAQGRPQLTARATYQTYGDAECEFGWRTSGVRYLVTDNGELVLEETHEGRRCHDEEGSGDGRISVVARPARQPGAPPLFHFGEAADEGSLVIATHATMVYQAVTFGCCDQSNTYGYFRLTDGARLMRSSDLARILDAPGFGTGLVGYQDGHSVLRIPEAERATTVVGVLSLAPLQGPVQRVLVHGGEERMRMDSLFLVLRGADGVHETQTFEHSNPERAGITAISVAVVLGDGGRVMIPVENGRLAVEKATVPAGVRLVRAPDHTPRPENPSRR